MCRNISRDELECAMNRWVICVVLGLLTSCAGNGPPTDALADARNERYSSQRRAAAVDRAVSEAKAGVIDAEEVREALKSLAWDGGAPIDVRLRAMERLLDDPANLDDTRRMMRLMLPHEPHLAMVHYLGEVAASRGWVDVTPSLVRRYARPARTIRDVDRPERTALMALHPGRSAAEIAFRVFLHPGESDGVPGHDWRAVTRADAWELGSRLDVDGSVLASVLEGNFEVDEDGGAVLKELRRCREDLGTLPRAGRELVWLGSLLNPAKRENAAWWGETKEAVARLKDAQRAGLRLRHAEVVRYASTHYSEWVAADREWLLREIEQRLAGRTRHYRSREPGETGPLMSERFEDYRDRMSWADALTVLVMDEIVREPGLVASLFSQAEADRADRTTEYGGLLFAGSSPGEARAEVFPPRPSQRAGDHSFVASADMIASGDLAMAHYHFHVQQTANGQYAGPSREDLAYAARFGRTCVVFTSIRANVLNVDVYTPEGIVIDLGEIRSP